MPMLASHSPYRNGPEFSSLNGSTSNWLSRREPASKPVSALDLPALQTASRVLQEHFVKDAQAVPDVGDMLTIPGAQSSAAYSIFPDDFRVPYQKRSLKHIPDALFQFYNTVDIVSHMGLLPEIERVWVSIDNKLFLWDYVEGEELSSFTEQPDNITAVKVVKPRPGVFVDEINYVLVIVTPFHVILLGLAARDIEGPGGVPRKDIKLYATDLKIATEVEMTDAAGTDDGRIFLTGAQDGHVYELHYQEKEGWFGKRIQLINHSVGGVQSFLPRLATARASEVQLKSIMTDTARNLLYTLTASNVINIYQPAPNKSLQHIQTLTNLYKFAQEKAPGSPALTPATFQIVSLHAVSSEESRAGIQLIAMTLSGVRLYFGPAAAPYGYYGASSSTSTRSLSLVHVRLPPANLLHPDEQTSPYQPQRSAYGHHMQSVAPTTSRPFTLSSIDIGHYSDGLTLACQPGDIEGYDFIFCAAPDLTRIGNFGQASTSQQPMQITYGNMGGGSQRPPLTERAMLLAIGGRTWGVASVSRPAKAILSTSMRSEGGQAPTLNNELAYQFLEPAQQFIILTNVGLHYIAKRRALDWLKDVVEEASTESNVQPIVEFRDSFGRDQTCAMLLALASGNTFLDLGEQSAWGRITTLPPDVSMKAKQAFYDCGERPLWTERVTYGSTDASGTAVYSGRREGLAMYFARLVRPIWKNKIVKLSPTGLRVSNIPDDLLFLIQRNLAALKDFLDKNPHLFHSASGDQPGMRAAPANDQEAWKAEQHSVAQIQALLARTVEGISFFLLLNDHQIGQLISRTDPEIQKAINELTFEELMTSDRGVHISRALVNVVIDQQIGQQVGVDTVSDVLQSRCGSFCSTDDVMLYKAKENTRRAVESRSPVERQGSLEDSLRLYVKGARILDLEQLREVIGDYQQLDFAKGAIELPLACAQARDIDGQGQAFWQSVPDIYAPSNDARKEFWDRRAQCYGLVLDSLEVFEQKAARGGDEAERVRAHAYELAFASVDEMFHSRMYDWLIGRGLADELLEMRPPYLRAHLQREPATVEKLQLLWQFLVKDSQPLEAAVVLAQLADSPQFPLSLTQRLEYLTIAVGNAKSHPVAVGGQHESAITFLTELEEKLEVAQVQLETLSAMAALVQSPEGTPEARDMLEALDNGLYDVTELYKLYAERYDLSTVKLLILHVSQHTDERLVQEIWSQIFDQITATAPGTEAAQHLQAKVMSLGQRFYPSEAAFPFRHVAQLLVNYQLQYSTALPLGWAPRILVGAGIPHAEVWDVLHQMYDSHVPPFNTPDAIRTVSGAICILLSDWLDAVRHSTSDYFPVDRIDTSVELYISELAPGEATRATREGYEHIRRELRHNW